MIIDLHSTMTFPMIDMTDDCNLFEKGECANEILREEVPNENLTPMFIFAFRPWTLKHKA